MSNIALWTSTQFQDWKADCVKYLATRQPFEVRDVYKPEHEMFCVDLCGQHQYTCVKQRHTAVCSPTASN
jgi:hypothetical protein